MQTTFASGNGALQNIFIGYYYDPVVGRFINADQPEVLTLINDVLDSNLYTFCCNDMINNYEIDAVKMLYYGYKKKIGCIYMIRFAGGACVSF